MTDPLPPLASADDLATLLGVESTDPKMALALRRASDRFRGAVGHPVSLVADDVVLLDGDGTRSLALPAAPIVGTPTVTVDGDPVTDFSVSPKNGVLRRDSCWPDKLGCIQVTYTHGYEAVPGDIADAVLEQAELQYSVLAGVSQMSLGSQSFAFGAQATVGVTQRWSDTVQKYLLNRGDRS
jgi:hypothetical protein